MPRLLGTEGVELQSIRRPSSASREFAAIVMSGPKTLARAVSHTVRERLLDEIPSMPRDGGQSADDRRGLCRSHARRHRKSDDLSRYVL